MASSARSILCIRCSPLHYRLLIQVWHEVPFIPRCATFAHSVSGCLAVSVGHLISLRYSSIHPSSGLNLLAYTILAPHTLIDPHCSSSSVRLRFVVLLVSCVIVSQLHSTGAAARFRGAPYLLKSCVHLLEQSCLAVCGPMVLQNATSSPTTVVQRTASHPDFGVSGSPNMVCLAPFPLRVACPSSP